MDPRSYEILFQWSGALGLVFLIVMLSRAMSTGRVPGWALLVSVLFGFGPFFFRYVVPGTERYLSYETGILAGAILYVVTIIYLRQPSSRRQLRTDPANPSRP
jgi:hypothetical protein